jgi:hypothetical protein
MKFETKQEGNYLSVTLEGKEIGHVFTTFHPTIPFEVYLLPSHKNKRVYTHEEALEWLKEQYQQCRFDVNTLLKAHNQMEKTGNLSGDVVHNLWALLKRVDPLHV